MFEGLAEADLARRSRPDAFSTRIETPRRGRTQSVLLQGPERSYDADATIYAQTEPADFIYQVVAGVVRTVTLRPDGRRAVHGFHLPGEIFGLEREKLHHCSAEAIGASRLVQWPQRRLDALAGGNADAARELWIGLLTSRDRTAERFMHVMHGTASEKLAYFLIDLTWRMRSEGRIQLPMSRYDIADYLGLASETVSRTFTVFRARGLISTQGREVRLLSDEILRLSGADDIAAHWPTTLA
ncbi:MAG: helix-turn-helix domain-containing protein [Alphaproteobacteria bacterium]|nr:helix-turn-helix domain-containing protein [Alphaproteobacteria bacterium]